MPLSPVISTLGYRKWNPKLNSAHRTAEATATCAIDNVAPTLRYSLRLMVTPFRFIVSSQITIANDPRGKKCGPKLFPIILLKIKPVRADPVAPMCWMLSNPRIVMGQLFMKLAPMVTTMLGPKIPSAEGNLLVATSAEASRFVMPAVSNPCTTMKMLNMNSTMSQLMFFANPLSPFFSPFTEPLRFNVNQ